MATPESTISFLRQKQSMAMLTTLQLPPNQTFLHKIKLLTTIKPTPTHCILPSNKTLFPIISNIKNAKTTALIATGLAITALVGPATAGELALTEPTNALSLPTWAIHVSSVAEWSGLPCFAFLDFLKLLKCVCVCVFFFQVCIFMFCLLIIMIGWLQWH